MQDILNSLIDDYGEEKVITAAKQLLTNKLQEKTPAGYVPLIQPEKVQESIAYIDNALADVTAAGKEVEQSYAGKVEIIKSIEQLKTSIEIQEAEAFMLLEGNKVQIDGKSVTLSNDKMRDMYRTYVTRESRQRLSELQADLKAIEIKQFKAKDRWDEAKINADLIKSRAYVQANLLNFLS